MDPQNYDLSQEANYYGDQPHTHPYLHEPLLYITNIPAYVSDTELAVAFVSCGPFRPKIERDGSNRPLSGIIEFKFLEKAEKALAILQSRPIPGLLPPVPLVLSPYPPTNPPTPLPPPSALPRLVKQLPVGFMDSQLYDIFRPFGALASARTQTQFGPDIGMVEFWNEEDAQRAEEAMHCAEIEGHNIAVQVYQSRRTASGSIADFSPNAPAFVPSGAMYSYNAQVASSPRMSPMAHPGWQYSPPRGSPYHPVRSPVPAFVHGPGQQVQMAPMSGPGANSHSGLIDPCNLFCKNLDPEIDSNTLFTHFRQFGQIVSARVMKNETGESRGFGFVSYQTPDQATSAMRAMNGVQLGSKQIVVRLHEPKQLRQEKLAQRFGGHNGHPRSASGATSPTASEAGESYVGWPSPRHHSSALGSPNHFDRSDRGRRSSGSYYNAALSGSLNLRYDDLAGLSPGIRKEVLTGEFSRRIKTMDIVASSEVDSIVESLVGLSLSEAVKYIEDPQRLTDKVKSIKTINRSLGSKGPAPAKSPSPSASQRSLTDGATAIASAPEHPSTPISVSASLSTPPRTSSPSGSVPPISERDRILSAISKLESTRQSELTDLLMSLPKRERALCLFNVEILRSKLADAKVVLDSEEDGDRPVVVSPRAKSAPPPAEKTNSTNNGTTVAASSSASSSGSLLGVAGVSKPAVSAPGTPMPTPAAAATQYTVASLARMPAVEFIKLARGLNAEGVLPVPLADPLVTRATDEFVDGLFDLAPQMQKQRLGDKLFKTVKSFGVKGAPKVTIALLDQEDLRSLAHLMNSYPAVLKDKALAINVGK